MVSLTEQRKSWDSKPLLQVCYREFFELVREKMVQGISLELGSGIGEFPHALHSDLPSVSAYNIPWPDGTISNLVMIDVFHHLEDHERFLREARRVLRPGGRLIVLEPYVSPFSALFYLWHDEPFRMTMKAQKILWKLHWLYFEPIVSFSWLFSGGYSHHSLYPEHWYGFMKKLDKLGYQYPKTFASRVLIVLSNEHLPTEKKC